MAKIMIVDDSTFARRNLRRTLSVAGYDIIEASSGQQAVDLAGKEFPDLVTLDLLMPGLTGLDTLKLLKNVTPNSKYVIITADIQDSTREELLNEGAHAFINKPFSEYNLLETLENLLTGKS
jgi:two-component system, chemotaxis family, chemotaxis protein CheY